MCCYSQKILGKKKLVLKNHGAKIKSSQKNIERKKSVLKNLSAEKQLKEEDNIWTVI